MEFRGQRATAVAVEAAFAASHPVEHKRRLAQKQQVGIEQDNALAREPHDDVNKFEQDEEMTARQIAQRVQERLTRMFADVPQCILASEYFDAGDVRLQLTPASGVE